MDDIVQSLAKALNSRNILWGIGGSYLLKTYGIVDEVHDLDIIVAAEDITKAIQVLDTIAKRKSIPVKDEYRTKHFSVYSYEGLSIDVMSTFRIEHIAGIYEFVLDELSIVDRRPVNGIEIPFTSLEDWLIAYKLMKGRDSKEVIGVNLVQCQIVTNELFLEGRSNVHSFKDFSKKYPINHRNSFYYIHNGSAVPNVTRSR